MPRRPCAPDSLHGWTVLSLRPRGQHGALRAAAGRHGARLLALSPHAIEPIDDAASRRDLRQALTADIVTWTSPNAVRAAACLMALKPRPGQVWLAVGSGTRGALQRLGIQARSPMRMDSEGLLAMPELLDVRGRRVGLVTAPGGRGVLAPALAARGAQVLRADVYARRPLAFGARALGALDDALQEPRRVLLALSSQTALDRLLAALPKRHRSLLAACAVVATSERLAALAREAGFARIAVAEGPAPSALLHAAVGAFV